jgi:hypothetical protein
MKTWLKIAILVIVALVVLYLVPWSKQPEVNDFQACIDAGYPVMESFPRQCKTPDGRTFTEQIVEGDVVISFPRPGEVVLSPLLVSGKARGNWFFEANLPVSLKDQTGKLLAQKGFQAKGEWMTTDYVPFEDTLEFEKPSTEYGLLIIEKDNPSGLPEHDDSYVVPVKFR